MEPCLQRLEREGRREMRDGLAGGSIWHTCTTVHLHVNAETEMVDVHSASVDLCIHSLFLL